MLLYGSVVSKPPDPFSYKKEFKLSEAWLDSQLYSLNLSAACKRIQFFSRHFQWLRKKGESSCPIQLFLTNYFSCHIFFTYSHFHLKLVCIPFANIQCYFTEFCGWVSHLNNFLNELKSSQQSKNLRIFSRCNLIKYSHILFVFKAKISIWEE